MDACRSRPAAPRSVLRARTAAGAPRADLDLGADQLARDSLGEHRIFLRDGAELLEAVVEGERLRVEDRELLLDPDREVRGGLEDLSDSRHLEHGRDLR